MSNEERNDLIEEQKALDEKIKNAAFISPKDMRRTQEITSLLLSDGATDEIRLVAGKPRQSNRVTSFTRDRR